MIGPPWWDDGPVILIGGGPSLRGFDFSTLAGRAAHIVGVNQAIFDAPCDAGVSADSTFIRERREALQAMVAGGVEIIVTVDGVAGATRVARLLNGGLSADPNVVRTGGCSGAAALNVTVLKRGRKIVLAGYDYQGGHYHDAYPWQRPHDGLRAWAGHYETTLPALAALGVTVIDASPHGALSCFPKAATIHQALDLIA